jgi:hypothetical protein
MGQPENVGDQVEPWSICTRSTNFGNSVVATPSLCGEDVTNNRTIDFRLLHVISMLS